MELCGSGVRWRGWWVWVAAGWWLGLGPASVDDAAVGCDESYFAVGVAVGVVAGVVDEVVASVAFGEFVVDVGGSVVAFPVRDVVDA